MLRTQASARPNKTALVWHPAAGEAGDEIAASARTWTYATFVDAVDAVAAGLVEQGVRPGDHVGIHLPNCPEFLLAYFACLTIGAVAVTTNTRSAPDELRFILGKAKVRHVVTDAAGWHMLPAECLDLCVLVGEAEVRSGICRTIGFDDLSSGPPRARGPVPAALDPAAVQFTSGTTSRPKGVVFTQANILWAGRVCASHAGLTANDTTLVIAPLFHVNALFYSVMATLWTGGTIVLVPKFSRRGFWRVAVDHRVSWLSIQPFAVRALALTKAPEHDIRFLGLGAADVGFVEDALGAPTVGWWGMTETISHGIVSVPGWRSRFMSMGMPAPEYEIRVTDEEGREVIPTPDGVRGRLWIRGVAGVALFLEYLDDPESTAMAFDGEGWFDTGDIVVVFDDGEILFGDREKDMLRIGGENVAASEIERVVLGVEGVIEAAVIGEPDPMLDERPVAFVITQDGQDLGGAILAACREKLADFKLPARVVTLPAFPRSVLDKIAKSELRKLP